MVYDVKSAAAILGISAQTVRQLCESGRLRAANVSSGEKYPRWRISQNAIDEFLSGGRQATPEKLARKRRARIDEHVKQVF